MSNHVFINGLQLSGYKGINKDLQTIAPFRQFNFFIGANNSGKSTVIEFIAQHISELDNLTSGDHSGIRLDADSKYLNIDSNIKDFAAFLGIPKKQFSGNYQSECETYSDFSAIPLISLIADKLSDDSDLIWYETVIKPGHDKLKPKNLIQLKDLEEIQNLNDAIGMLLLITRTTKSSRPDFNLTYCIEALLRNAKVEIPKTDIIPAIRKVSGKGEKFDDCSGKGLIEKLAELQNPRDYGKDRHRQFNKINRFLKTVLGKPDASIEIPHDRSEILVHIDGRAFPLESLGTGIHEVVILASFCTLLENQIICIEEPEIHLHPALQRRLISYLQKETNNQYFIATHSASIIDAQNIDTSNTSIFHVTNENGSTRIRNSNCEQTRLDAVKDLGYKASDLIQSNCIIWVEGPSDRIYINHWIRAKDEALIEGIHYSIMFYGGRLLSHLSTCTENELKDEVENLIAVHKLNQNLAFIIDSDKSKSTGTINKTKERIKNTISENNGICWITNGREIENYVNPTTINSILTSLYPNLIKKTSDSIYAHALHFDTPSEAPYKKADKIKVAHAVTEHQADFSVLDLDEKMNALIEFIRSSNR